jgi:hypothetical protein
MAWHIHTWAQHAIFTSSLTSASSILNLSNNFTHYSRYFYSYQIIEKDGPNNGELGTDKHDNTINEDDTYYYWYDTYPLEYAVFLLDSALARGVYYHTMAANDAFYERGGAYYCFNLKTFFYSGGKTNTPACCKYLYPTKINCRVHCKN